MVVMVFLAFGALIGGAARLLLPGRQDLGFSSTVLLGLLGAGTVGSAIGGVTDGWIDWGGPSLIGSLLGAFVFVAIAEAINRRYRQRRLPTPTDELLHKGESSRVEFKSSARYNLHTGDKDARIELAIARSVAGLANTDGGVLLIGVNDDSQPIGLAEDLRLVKGGDLDAYELWLHDLLETCLGRSVLRHVEVSFERFGDADVCRIDVGPAEAPVYLRPHTGERRTQLHVRTGNSTRELAVDDAVEHVTRNWPEPAVVRMARQARHRLRRRR